MPGIASISGVISGLKTDEIISKLLELEGLPIARQKVKQDTLSTRLAAWQEVNTRILAVKSKSDLLAQASTFDAKSFTSSDTSLLTGSATYSAQAGTYYLKVNALARAQQVASDGYADISSTAVGTGTIAITVGTSDPTVITIDDSNNSLAGLRDAINKSGAGVTAAIIGDGSGASPYRLMIASKTSGTSGAFTVDVNLSGGTAPVFTTLQSAQDASVTLGDGDGAITVTSGTNEIDDLLPGVTLNLQAADPAKTVTVTIAESTDSLKQAIKDLVEQYNNLIDYINQQFKFDTATNRGGTLFADVHLMTIHADMVSRISNPVAQLAQTAKVLSQIGITMTNDNKLNINETDLAESLAAGADAIKRLFAAVGEASNGYVTYIASTDKTKVSDAGGYAVEITAVATQARIIAGAAQTENLAQDEVLTIRGVAINLTAGMTPEQVVAKINEYTSETGVTASRTGADGTGTGDYLTLVRVAYGSAQTISAVSSVSNGGAAPVQNTSGIGTVSVTEASYAGETGTGTGAAGTDVAGAINGEAATGTGQILVGNEGNANTEGLRIKITAIQTGSYGTVTLTKGVASLLSDYLRFVTAPDTGVVKSAQSALTTEIDDIGDYIVRLEERIEARKERLIRQFAAMESALSKLQGQGSYLASQITAASKGWKE